MLRIILPIGLILLGIKVAGFLAFSHTADVITGLLLIIGGAIMLL